MGDVVHTSRINIVREQGPTRRAIIEGFARRDSLWCTRGYKEFLQSGA